MTSFRSLAHDAGEATFPVIKSLGDMEAIELTPSLVARTVEFEALKRHIQAAIEGKGRIVLVAGEAGIGKTRLSEELMKHASLVNVKILYGRTVPHSLSPYLVFADALEELFEIHPSDSVATRHRKVVRAIRDSAPEILDAIPIVSELVKVPRAVSVTISKYRQQELEPQANREKLFESVAHLILTASRTRPILMILEDLHWADPSSLGLLHYLARNITSTHTLIVGTYRKEELQEPAPSPHPLLDMLRLMRRESLPDEITLDRFNAEEVAELVEAILGQPPEDLSKILYHETEGNPLFVIEVLKLLTEEGLLFRSNSSWKLKQAIPKLSIPEKVHEVILRRVEKLPQNEREVLECGAVVGDPFDSRILERILKLDRARLLRALNIIEKKYRLIAYEEGLYHFDHSMIREVVYEELGEELRQQYHLETAMKLEELHRDALEAHHAAIAYHYMMGGDVQDACGYYRRAADDARSKYANEEAILYLRQALSLSPEAASRNRAEILEELGDLSERTGNFDEAIKHWNQAIPLNGEEERKAVLNRKIGTVLGIRLGRNHEAFERYQTALRILEPGRNEEELATLYHAYAGLHAQTGNFEEANHWCQKATELASKKGNILLLAKCYNTLGTMLFLRGNAVEGISYLEKALELTIQEGQEVAAVPIIYNLGSLQVSKGNFHSAFEYFLRGLRLVKQAGYLSMQPWFYDGLAWTYLDMGNVRRALESAKLAVDVDRRQGQLRHLSVSLCGLGRVQMKIGELEPARATFEEALKLAEETHEPTASVLSHLGLGEVETQRRDMDQALRHLSECRTLLLGTKDKFLTSLTLPVLAAICIETGALAEAREALRELRVIADSFESPVVSAVTNRLLGKLDAAREEWKQCFEHLNASLELYRSVEQPFEEAKILTDLASAHVKKGGPESLGEALKTLSGAIAIFERLEEWKQVELLEAEKGKLVRDSTDLTIKV